MKDHSRRCAKCGKSPVLCKNLKMYRFPKPSPSVYRCESWARFLNPNEEWTSKTLHRKHYSSHKMLCEDHFKKSSFADYAARKLYRHAIPSEDVLAPQASVSHTKTTPTSVNACAGVSFMGAGQVPCTSTAVSHTKTTPTSMNAYAGVSFMGAGQEPCTSTAVSHTKTTPTSMNACAGVSFMGAGQEPCTSTAVSHTKTTPTSMNAYAGVSFMGAGQEPCTSTAVKSKRLYNLCRRYLRRICNLKKQLRTKNKTDILKYLATDKAVEELSRNMTSPFAVLLQGQIQNNQKKSRGRRWNINQKLIALQLYKRSPACYRLLRRLFCLPCQTTLKNVLNLLPLSSGVNMQIFDTLKKKTAKEVAQNNECMLLFDEMSIRKHLCYNSRMDHIEGFQDHGPTQGRDRHIASHALVFMIVGIRKRFKQPIAYYLSGANVTADRLTVLIKEVLNSCLAAGIKIAATVCDMDGVNRRALSILGTSTDHPYFHFNDEEIVAIYDTPHLLKCFRNLFMKYDIKCRTGVTNDGKEISGVAKWSHVSNFFEEDNKNPFFVFAPLLTKDHISPNNRQKMRVKLAAQVLSHTVAAGIYAKVSQGVLTADAVATANLISKVDCLFDALNADSADLRNGKKLAQNLSDRSPHLNFFKEMIPEIRNLVFIGAKQRPPSQDGWLQTIMGVERLWRNMKAKYPTQIGSLATRRLQQDPLENFFGCVRSNCGSNVNPTVAQFVAGFKTAIISSLTHTNTRTNCEDDQIQIMSNLNNFLTNKATLTVHDKEDEMIISEEERQNIAILAECNTETQDLEIQESEEQACAYVCGYIIKRMGTSCSQCLQSLATEDCNSSHLFVLNKEFDDQKRLKYASDDFIKCIEACASIIYNYLENNSYKVNVKKNIIQILKENINFMFMAKCEAHCSEVISTTLNCVFYICINRFCVIKNRMFSDEASRASLKKKINILQHV